MRERQVIWREEEEGGSSTKRTFSSAVDRTREGGGDEILSSFPLPP